MWTTFALAALSLAPGRAGDLSVSNVRSTYCVRGAARPDNKLLPGDQFVLSFEVDGVTVDGAGKVLYSMSTEVTDSRGKVQHRSEPKPLEATVALGGGRMPGFATVDVGLDQPPGEYTMKVTLTDRAARTSTTVTQKFEVLPKGFGITRVTTTSDPEGIIATSLFGAGETMWFNFRMVGFARDSTSKQPSLSFELRVLDDKGNPTLAKPFTGSITKDVPANVMSIPAKFLLSLNRPGKFTIELKVNDAVGNKKASMTMPLTVLPST
jgi:hypothetical protein